MPEGQFLGSKTRVLYTTDSGKRIVFNMDDDLVVAGSGLPVYNPASPPENVVGRFPRFKPRGVHWQATAAGFEGSRKFLICGSPSAALYASDAPQTITIDGVAGITTGKRGEKYSF